MPVPVFERGICDADFLSNSADETRAFAEAFARALPDDSFVALGGDLGAGKTTFVKGVARGLGISEKVKSPSFNVMSVYVSPGGKRLAHIDAYRLGGDSEFESLMLDEIVPPPRCVCVEWWENVAGAVPSGAVKVFISSESESRRLIRVRV